MSDRAETVGDDSDALPPWPEDLPPDDGAPDAGDALPAGAEPPSAGAAEDHALVRRAQGGDEDAFAALVRRHQDRAYRVARNLLPNREDALDLAQEAFVRVYRNLARFDFRHEFTTWLYRIVTNLCIDHLRKRRPAVSTSGSGEDDDPAFDLSDEHAADPGAGLEQAELRVRVRSVIDSLAPHFRSVLVLRELEGLPCTEIARIVGATHVTVRWRLHRGRKLFQEEWERRERLADAGPAGSEDAPNIPPDPHVAPRERPDHG